MSIQTRIENWIEHYIIRYNLCPFAKSSFDGRKIVYTDWDGLDLDILQSAFLDFLARAPHEIDSSFLILPKAMSWESFLDLLYGLEALIEETEGLHLITLVPFHPAYMHAGHETAQTVHYSNRAPVPLIQMIHKDDVSERTRFLSIEDVLAKNSETLEVLGIEQLKIQFKNL